MYVPQILISDKECQEIYAPQILISHKKNVRKHVNKVKKKCHIWIISRDRKSDGLVTS